jgi:hypothetical protein
MKKRDLIIKCEFHTFYYPLHLLNRLRRKEGIKEIKVFMVLFIFLSEG